MIFDSMMGELASPLCLITFLLANYLHVPLPVYTFMPCSSMSICVNNPVHCCAIYLFMLVQNLCHMECETGRCCDA